MDAKALEGQKKLVVRASTHQQHFFLFSHCKLLCREALIFTSTTLCGSAALFVQNAAELRTKSSAVRAPGRTINPVVRVVPSGSAVPQHFPRQEVAWI